LALFQFSLWLSIDFRYHFFGSLVLLFSTVSSLISFCSFLLVLPPGSDRRRLLTLLRGRAVPTAVPALLLPERIAVIDPGQQDADLACRQQAAGVAAQYRLHGSDTVYTIVALCFSSTLITPGRERRKRMVEALLAHYQRGVEPASFALGSAALTTRPWAKTPRSPASLEETISVTNSR